jgi:hypothetical protein
VDEILGYCLARDVELSNDSEEILGRTMGWNVWAIRWTWAGLENIFTGNPPVIGRLTPEGNRQQD